MGPTRWISHLKDLLYKPDDLSLISGTKENQLHKLSSVVSVSLAHTFSL